MRVLFNGLSRSLALTLLLLSAMNALAAKSTNLSPATYNTLNEVQTLLGESKNDEAEAELKDLIDDLKPGFGLALAYQVYGQLELSRDQQNKAIGWFQKSLALDALTDQQTINLSTTVAQLLLAQEKYVQAVKELQPRFDLARKQESEAKQQNPDAAYIIPPVTFITLATAYQVNKEYAVSIPLLREAIKREKEKGNSPKENWLQMLMSAHYQLKQYKETAVVLDDLLRINPQREDYWQQQVGVYQILQRFDKALVSLELGYAGGYVTKPDSIILLVQLLINQNIPERAGRILQKHLNNGDLELNDKNWKLLAAAWQQGRERDKAAEAMLSASKFLEDGKLILRAAQLKEQNSDFKACMTIALDAIEKGLDDDDKGRALLLAGRSATELNDLKAARRYFQQALTLADSAANARSWLEYINALEEYPQS